MKIAFELMAAALALSGCNPPDQLRAEAPPSPCQSAAALATTFPPEVDERGGVRFIVDHTLDRLTALRGPGESYSDVMLRLAKG